MTTLLEKALTINPNKKRNTKINNEHVELALAWLSDKINLKQASQALNSNSSNNTIYGLALALREAYNQGKLIINY